VLACGAREKTFAERSKLFGHRSEKIIYSKSVLDLEQFATINFQKFLEDSKF